MSLETLFFVLGHLLTFIGTFVEGEITIMTSAFLASQGNLSIALVIIAGTLGVFCADNWWFYVGKRFGTRFISSHKHIEKRAVFVQQMLEKNQILVVLLFRYAWGFRIVTPVVLGTTHISRKRFFLYTLITTPIWALIFSSIGYVFGDKLTAVIAYVRSIEIAIFTLIICLILFFVYQKYEQKLVSNFTKTLNASKKMHKKMKKRSSVFKGEKVFEVHKK